MDPSNQYQDYLLLLVLPLTIISMREAIKNWSSLWDITITANDRNILLRFAMFVLMPIVVFLHECGHAGAILLFGGTVAEFHYGLLWGYVVPNGLFTPEQVLIIYLAGNVVEVLAGLLCLLAALVISSPPVVAVLVYLGLFSVAGTVIFYALMSTIGMYGDWLAIYTTTVTSWLPYIAACQAILVAGIAYCLLGSTPQLWFACKTHPNWATRWRLLKEKVNNDGSAENYLNLAWIYFEQGLTRLARKTVDEARSVNSGDANLDYLDGWICVTERKPQRAKQTFSMVAQNPTASSWMKATAIMSIAEVEEDEIRTSSRSENTSKEKWAPALEAYTLAEQADPTLGDAKVRKARLLNKLGLHTEALQTLDSLGDAKWSNYSLAEQVQVEYDLARVPSKSEK